jgi:hypothetical protein
MSQYIIYLSNNVFTKDYVDTLRSIAAERHYNTTGNRPGAITCLEHHIEVLHFFFIF